jgi:hypothetical protein
MDEEWLEEAKRLTKRQPDGGFIEKELTAALANLIPVGDGSQRLRIAESIVDSKTKPGSTLPTGQLRLPGREPYDYEPLRLIRDGCGLIIEQDRATLRYKVAEFLATEVAESKENSR